MSVMENLFALSPERLVLVLILLAIPILPNLWSIWHAFHRDFPTVQEKMSWISVAVFVPVLGGIAYLFLGRPRSRKIAPLSPGEAPMPEKDEQ